MAGESSQYKVTLPLPNLNVILLYLDLYIDPKRINARLSLILIPSRTLKKISLKN